MIKAEPMATSGKLWPVHIDPVDPFRITLVRHGGSSRNATKRDQKRRREKDEVKKDDVSICLRGHEVGCASTMFAMFLAVSVFLVPSLPRPT